MEDNCYKLASVCIALSLRISAKLNSLCLYEATLNPFGGLYWRLGWEIGPKVIESKVKAE